MTKQRGHRNPPMEADLIEVHQLIEADVGQVPLDLAHDMHRRQKLRVEVLGRKLESTTAITPDDGDDVPGAHSAHRPLHAGAPVVVCRDRQRPGLELPVIFLQQTGGRPGCLEGVPALVHEPRHAHVSTSGSGHELPHAHGAPERARVVPERGFHQRQVGKLQGELAGRKDLAHVFHVTPGPPHPGRETLADPPLYLDPVRRDATPHELRAHGTDHSPCTRPRALLDLHHPVYLRHVLGVEEHEFVGVVVEKDRLPEFDGGFEPLGGMANGSFAAETAPRASADGVYDRALKRRKRRLARTTKRRVTQNSFKSIGLGYPA